MSNESIRPILDHVVINVMDNLDGASAQFTRLGFQLTARGHHSLGSSNHLAIFGSDYLELLGFLPGRETMRADLWQHPPGLTGLVFKLDDPDHLYAVLRARGVPVQEPISFQRPVALPEGERDARFTVVRVSGEAVQNGRTFFCHHHTPDLVWRPEWRVHRNGVTAISEFVIASREPSRTAALFEQMFGPELLTEVAGGVSFRAGDPTILVLKPEAVAERYAGATIASEDGSDRMVALTFKVASLDATRALFDAERIPHHPLANGGIVVPYTEAANAALAFIE
jgi:hypothetical protein